MRFDVSLADGSLLKVAALDEPHRTLAVGAAVNLAYDPARVTVLP
jgi:hypothetical protein